MGSVWFFFNLELIETQPAKLADVTVRLCNDSWHSCNGNSEQLSEVGQQLQSEGQTQRLTVPR